MSDNILLDKLLSDLLFCVGEYQSDIGFNGPIYHYHWRQEQKAKELIAAYVEKKRRGVVSLPNSQICKSCGHQKHERRCNWCPCEVEAPAPLCKCGHHKNYLCHANSDIAAASNCCCGGYEPADGAPPEPPPAEPPMPQTIDDLALSFAFEIYSREKIELASEFFQIAPEVRMTFKQFIARLIRFHGEAKERGL